MRYVESTGTGVPMQVKPVLAKEAGASATLVLLAAAPEKRSSIHGIVLSTDTVGEYFITIGAEEVFRFYFGANGGVASPTMYPFYIEGDALNAAITLNKPLAAKTSVTLFAGQA